MTRPKRKAVPMQTQRDVALRQLGELMRKLGFEVQMFELDHDPALELRPVDPETGEHEPHQHDANYLVWLPKANHRDKTHGKPAGESKLNRRDGDQQKIAKAKRLAKSHEEMRRRLLVTTLQEQARERRKRTWPKRPFPKRREP